MKPKTDTWTYTFDEMGGYDSMTGAFALSKGGQLIAVIDQAYFGQELCQYELLPEVESIVKAMVEKLNG